MKGWLRRAVLIELEGGSQGISSGERKRPRCLRLSVKYVGERSCICTQPYPKQVALAQLHTFPSASISSSTMCIPTNHPFLKPFSSLKKAIARSRSPMPQSTDIASNDLARPSSDLPILITPSSTIRAADIAMPVTSKIPSNLHSPN